MDVLYGGNIEIFVVVRFISYYMPPDFVRVSVVEHYSTI